MEVKLEDPKLVQAIYKALLVECLNPPDKHRGEVKVDISEGNMLIITIKATSLSSARALLNSYLTLLATSLDTLINTRHSVRVENNGSTITTRT